MDQAEADAAARQGYDQMAQVYTDHVGLEMRVPSLVRAVLDTFAHQVQQLGPGQVVDAGCGPGHVTAYLADLGLDIFGVDNSPGLIDIARANHPGLRFELGQLAALPVDTGSLLAIVSRHSLIHTPAKLVPAALDEFARVLAPDGLLFVSFFGAESSSTHGQAFNHAVTTAYQLDVEIMGQSLREAGFVEQMRMVRQPGENDRQLEHGFYIANLAG